MTKEQMQMRVNKAMDKEMLKSGTMGDESAWITMTLNTDEFETFCALEIEQDKRYSWEYAKAEGTCNGYVVDIRYCENGI